MNLLSYSLPLQSYESIHHTIKFMGRKKTKHRDESCSTIYNPLLAREYTKKLLQNVTWERETKSNLSTDFASLLKKKTRERPK